jgi:glycosyltransferase involved in cell wall biosynthesis
MNISIINLGEPLPTDASKPRWYRAGLLARYLAERGHSVTWWASGFDHFTKKHRSQIKREFHHESGIKICLLPTPKYKNNISFRRFYNHVVAGDQLKSSLNSLNVKPDLIFCAFPPIETAYEAVRYGLAYGIPVVVDVRDRWPELIAEQLPHFFIRAARLMLWPYYRKTRVTFKESYALTGTTQSMLDFGLEMAGRKETDKDKVFLMTYEKPIFSEWDTSEAEKYWDNLGVCEDTFNICFFGTFVNQKAVDLPTCIKGFDVLDKDQKDKFKLIMCGDGPTLKESQALSCSSNIIFTGRINSAQIWTLMKRCKLGVLPYKPESHFLLSVPNKAAEYFAGNLPIVTSLTDGTLFEVLRDSEAGLFYDSGDPNSFKSTVLSLSLDISKYDEMKNNVANLYARDFDSETVLSSVSDWLENIAAGY